MGTAFVLTGGGSLGVVQVGMVAALQDHGIEPDLLVGTSVGALNAAHLAGHGTTEGRLGELVTLWQRLRRRDVVVPRAGRWLAAMVGAAPSLFADTSLRALVEGHLGYGRLEEARLPVHVVATDLVTGLGLALTRGPATSAVLASAAVPGLLPPVQRHGRTLVDGAVGEFDALRHADACGVDDIYLLPAGYPCAGSQPVTALGTTLTALSLPPAPAAAGPGARLRRSCAAPRPAAAVPAVGVTCRLHPGQRADAAQPSGRRRLAGPR